MRILFLTGSDLSTNPRAIKEIDFLIRRQHQVTVIGFETNGWSRTFSRREKVRLIRAGADVRLIKIGKSRIRWVILRMGQKFFKNQSGTPFFNSLKVSPKSLLLLRTGMRILKHDIIIGHTIPALYPVSVLKQTWQAKAVFDFEDFYPGENSNAMFPVKELIRQCLVNVDFFTFSSQSIKTKCEREFGIGKNGIVIYNFFPALKFLPPMPGDGRLRMVWFSQKVGKGRGLERIWEAVTARVASCELHLIGDADIAFIKERKKSANIFIHGSVQETELLHSLSRYDVGLALESGKDENNLIAFSNKMAAYVQAGMMVIATKTPGQLELKNDAVIFIDNLEKDFEACLDELIISMDDLRKNAQERYRSAQHFSIENNLESWYDKLCSL